MKCLLLWCKMCRSYLASGGFAPSTPTRGFAPGPHPWGASRYARILSHSWEFLFFSLFYEPHSQPCSPYILKFPFFSSPFCPFCCLSLLPFPSLSSSFFPLPSLFPPSPSFQNFPPNFPRVGNSSPLVTSLKCRRWRSYCWAGST